jgi:hypothetical protein
MDGATPGGHRAARRRNPQNPAGVARTTGSSWPQPRQPPPPTGLASTAPATTPQSVHSSTGATGPHLHRPDTRFHSHGESGRQCQPDDQPPLVPTSRLTDASGDDRSHPDEKASQTTFGRRPLGTIGGSTPSAAAHARSPQRCSSRCCPRSALALRPEREPSRVRCGRPHPPLKGEFGVSRLTALQRAGLAGHRRGEDSQRGRCRPSARRGFAQ